MLGESDELTAGDIERARLIGFAVRRGVSAGDVARICAEHGDMLASFVGLLEAPGRTRIFTFDEVAERAAVDPGLLDRVWTASGLRDQSYAYDEDVEALGWTKTAFQIGIPEDVVLQIVRVFADNLSRVADAANRLFHLYVHERFRAEGLSGPELFAATQAI